MLNDKFLMFNFSRKSYRNHFNAVNLCEIDNFKGGLL